MTDKQPEVLEVEHLHTIRTERGPANVLRVNGQRLLCFPGAAIDPDNLDQLHPTAAWPEAMGDHAPFPPALPDGPMLPAFLLGYANGKRRFVLRGNRYTPEKAAPADSKTGLFEEAARAARDIFDRRTAGGGWPLDRTFVRLVAAEAYGIGAIREAERAAHVAATRVERMRAELADD